MKRMKRRGRGVFIGLVCGAAALAVAERAVGHGEIIIARTVAGRLVAEVEGAQPIPIEASVFPGIDGFATGLTGFHSTDAEEPGEDRFLLSPTSDIRAVFVGADAGLRVYNGTHLMSPGDEMVFGSPAFDYHPIFNIQSGVPGDAFRVRLVFRDASGTYQDSDEFPIAFTPTPPEACPADLNADGTLNVSDFLRFLSLYAAGQPLADLNHDETVSVGDFLAYMAEYAAGCR